jgi:hypothetical protein
MYPHQAPKVLRVLIILLILSGIIIAWLGVKSCHASFFGLLSNDDFSLFKSEIQLKLADNVGEINGLKLQMKNMEFALKMQNEAAAMINSNISKISSELKLTGNNNHVNDAAIFTAQLQAQKEIAVAREESYKMQLKYANKETMKLYWLLGIMITGLLSIIKRFMTINSNAQYYQTKLAAMSKEDDFETIMVEKRKHDNEKKLLTKASKFVKSGIDFVQGKKEA